MKMVLRLIPIQYILNIEVSFAILQYCSPDDCGPAAALSTPSATLSNSLSPKWVLNVPAGSQSLGTAAKAHNQLLLPECLPGMYGFQRAV